MDTETIIYSSNISKFVDTAIRTSFDVILLTYDSKGGEKYFLSTQLTDLAHYIEHGYNLFVDQVYEIENTKALENRFLPNIDRYNLWYSKNQVKITKLFGAHNVYSNANETLQFTKKKIVEVTKKEEPKEDKYKNEGWFKVGLLFANGEMENLLINHKHNATHIAKDKFKENWKKYRPHISESMSNNINSNNNIYSNRDKMLKIKTHCKENDITVVSSFLDNMPPE